MKREAGCPYCSDLIREGEKCVEHSWEGQWLRLTLNQWEKREGWLSGWPAGSATSTENMLWGDTILISKDRVLSMSAHFKMQMQLKGTLGMVILTPSFLFSGPWCVRSSAYPSVTL